MSFTTPTLSLPYAHREPRFLVSYSLPQETKDTLSQYVSVCIGHLCIACFPKVGPVCVSGGGDAQMCASYGWGWSYGEGGCVWGVKVLYCKTRTRVIYVRVRVGQFPKTCQPPWSTCTLQDKHSLFVCKRDKYCRSFRSLLLLLGSERVFRNMRMRSTVLVCLLNHKNECNIL